MTGVCDHRGAGLGDLPGRCEKVFTASDICIDNSSKRLVSSETCAVSWSVVVIVGSGDNSIMQSASCASWSRLRSPADGVSTIRTFDRNR